MAKGTRLESVRGESLRGFKSHPFRHGQSEPSRFGLLPFSAAETPTLRSDGLRTGSTLAAMARRARPATVQDVHDIAAGMPHVTVTPAGDNPVYQVGGRSFVFFRNPRPDAVDAVTGERLRDVIVIWVASLDEKRALVDDPDSPWFTTPHFDGHLSVLVRASRLGEIDREELAEVVQDAWLSRASRARATAWLADHGLGDQTKS